MKVSSQPGRAAPQVFPQVVAMVIVLLLQVDSTSAMRQVDLDYVAPVYLSTFDGYSYGHTFGTDGRISFFYSLPTSSRSEQRTASGEVTGQYAFVAPEGNEFQFRYEADDDGYRVQSDALPVPPQDTDDVKRAKEEFFAAYQKALELAGSDEDYDDYSSSEESSEEIYGHPDVSSEEDDSDSDSDESSEDEDHGGLPVQNLVRVNTFGQRFGRPNAFYVRR